MSHFWAVLLGPPQCGPDTPWHDSKLLFTPIQDARRFWPAPGLGAFLPFQLASSQLSELWSAELARQPGRATCGEPASGLRRCPGKCAMFSRLPPFLSREHPRRMSELGYEAGTPGILAQPLTSSVTLAKFFKVNGLQFSYLENGSST